MKQQIFMIETSFLKYSPWRSMHFCMHLNQFLNYFVHSYWGNCKTCVWIDQPFLRASKIVVHVIYFWSTEQKVNGCQIKVVRRFNHHFDNLAFQIVSPLGRCMRARIAMMKNYEPVFRVFQIPPTDFGKLIVVYHSILNALCFSNDNVTTWLVLPKKQTTICFDLILARTTCVGFCLSWKTHTIDCCFVSDSYA